MLVTSLFVTQLPVQRTELQTSRSGETVQQPNDTETQENENGLLARLEANRTVAGQSTDEATGPNQLTPEEQEVVDDLQDRDQEVRQHERAHATVGGSYAGQPSYTTVTGPDGRQYAVAGEVQIDTSEVSGDPQATIRKMDVIIRAALAPADPSAQDRQVAATARSIRQQAQAELRNQSQQTLLNAQEESIGGNALEDLVAQVTEAN